MNKKYGLAGAVSEILLIVGVTLLTACASPVKPVPAGLKTDPSIIAVSTPGVTVPRGASVAWLDKAINVYRDERLDSATVQYMIEDAIRSSLVENGYRFVDDRSAAQYTIAYTAALESALDDATILRQFGLVPGNLTVPVNNPTYEKGTLVIYVLDGNNGDVIWRSAAQAAVDFSLENEEREQRIERVVRDMFSSFPTDKAAMRSPSTLSRGLA